MTAVAIRSWAAWSPGIETNADWEAWSADPRPLAQEGAPEVRFIPAMLRRRCDQLSRMMLHVVHHSAEPADLATMTSVFASRHGSLSTMVAMLEELAVDAPLSPARFSHSVHNTQAGIFSIWAKNHGASTSIAARQQTFAHGFLEAASILHSQAKDAGPVLFVTGDAAVPDILAPRAEPNDGAYALALVLERSDGEGGLQLDVEPGAEPRPTTGPEALAFLRWILSDPPAATLRLVHPERTWAWRRV